MILIIQKRVVKFMMDFQSLLDDLYTYINSKSYYAALVLSLIIPDACSQVLNKSKQSKKEDYIKWFEDYVSRPDDLLYQFHYVGSLSIDGKTVYSLRNYMFHNGTPDIKHNIDDEAYYFEFGESSTKFSSHQEINGKTKVIINVPYLCDLLYKAGKKFYEDNKKLFPKANDYREVMPNGF